VNKFLIISFATLLNVGIYNSCLAMPILINDGGIYNGTNVGSIDIFRAEDDKQGNPQAEENWVNSILAPTNVEWTIKQDPVAYYSTDSAGVFAFAFDPTPGDPYFIIKNANRIALFENINDLDWGVFDTAVLSPAMNLPSSDYEISHVTRFSEGGSPPFQVPEPGTIALFSVGLLGMGLSSIRRRRKAS
jgi:hypothetical protein